MKINKFLKEYEFNKTLVKELGKHSDNSSDLERHEVFSILDKFKNTATAYLERAREPLKKLEAQERIDDIITLEKYAKRIILLEFIQAKYVSLGSKHADLVMEYSKVLDENMDLKEKLEKLERINNGMDKDKR